jgi:ubiquinone/menaquinone biosynthesis C-methylase UbiE
MAEFLAGKWVMVPGCGFGDDAIRLVKLHAEVHAFDLSPDLVDIAGQRAALMAVAGINFKIMPAAALTYPDNSLIWFTSATFCIT